MSDLVETPRTSTSPDNLHASAARRQSLRGWCAWCAVSLLMWSMCATFARSDDELVPGQPGVLLLENNRLQQGRITPQGDTYSVEQTAGTLIVAKDQVRFVGINIRAVYVHLQDQLPQPPQANDHVELARWCIAYRLMPEARFELQSALEVDPSRDDIRRNLNQLDSLLKRPPTESKPVKSETPAQRMAKLAGIQGHEVESLGGLSRDAGQIFTRKIQPILMHNCTASACHGPKSDQTFKLNLVYQSSGQQHSTTSKNLLALMPYIDRESPKSGKLWKLLKSNHDAVGNSIFLGPKGKAQQETFQNWLLALKQESDDDSESVRSAVAAKPRYRKGAPSPATTVIQASAEVTAAPLPEVVLSTPEGSEDTKPRTAPATGKRTTGTKPRTLPETEPIISDEPPVLPDAVVEDPFNPNEFNSRQRIKNKFGS